MAMPNQMQQPPAQMQFGQMPLVSAQASAMQEDGDADPKFSGVGFCCGCVDSGTVHAIQACGAYTGYAEAGLYWYIPLYHTSQPVDVKVQQHLVNTDCKTKDQVQLSVVVAVQFKIDKDHIEKAVFKTGDPHGLIDAVCQNVVRSAMTNFDLDDAYSTKQELSKAVFAAVASDMNPKGYTIKNCLIVDIRPDARVLASMNQINASKRQRQAAVFQGEAHKVLQVKAAEADAESKYLSGNGMARMRVEMAKGFKDSMDAMKSGGLSATEVMNMMITTQYVDMLNDFAVNPNKTAVMMPLDDPDKDMEAKVRDGFISAARLGSA